MSDDVEIKTKFEDAVKRSNNLPNQPPEVLLKMYGFYKQALNGDVTGKRPGRINLKARYKFDAWESNKGISREEAMKLYIDLINELEQS